MALSEHDQRGKRFFTKVKAIVNPTFLFFLKKYNLDYLTSPIHEI